MALKKKRAAATADAESEELHDETSAAAKAQLQKILSQSSSVTQLEHLCSALGWGRRFFYDDDAGWVAEVISGCGETHRVETGQRPPKTKKGEKAGRNAAAQAAVEALQQLAERALSTPSHSLEAALGFDRAVSDAAVLDSSPSAWRRLWEALDGVPEGDRSVGVGTEGNDGQGAPVLVQVAVKDLVLVELPRRPAAAPGRKKAALTASGGGGELSDELKKLLADPSVTKVFCDSAGQRDLKSLGLTRDSAGVVDLEQRAADVFGRSSAPRGIARIASLVFGKRIDKLDPDWAEFEKGGAEESSISQFSAKAVRHAALEAYSNLRVWEAFRQLPQVPREPIVHRSASSSANASAGAAKESDLLAIDDELAALEAQLQALDGASDADEDEGSQGEQEEEEPEALNGVSRKRPAAAAARGSASSKRSRPDSPDGDMCRQQEAWRGWKEALDDELRSGGGMMHFQRLQKRLVARYQRCEGAAASSGAASEERLMLEALACIPQSYLSQADAYVRIVH